MSESDSQWPLRLVIPGRPRGKERPRVSIRVNKKGKHWAYTPKATESYEKTVAWAAKAAMGRRKMLTGPVHLTICCSFSAKIHDWHVSKPDWDNLGKVYSDAFNGIIYKDDSQVASVTFIKINDLKDEVTILIEPILSISGVPVL